MDKQIQNDLGVVAAFFAKQHEDKQQQIVDFNANLRSPDAIMTVGEKPYNYDYGFWRVDDGVVRLRKFSNGYSPWDERIDYTNEELDILAGCLCKMTVPMDEE
jgi:hypothetical protein